MEQAFGLADERDFKDGVRGFTERAGGQWLGEHGIRANQVSWTGIGLSVAACFIWALQIYWWPFSPIGVGLGVFGSYFDVIDGAVAKHQPGGTTPFGGYLDSNGDRWVDVAIGSALLFVTTAHHRGKFAILACGLMIGFSVCVPYARAKAELAKARAKNGIGDRLGRLIATGAGVLLVQLSDTFHSYRWLPGHLHLHYDYVAWLVLLMSVTAVAQRTMAVKRQLDKPQLDQPATP